MPHSLVKYFSNYQIIVSCCFWIFIRQRLKFCCKPACLVFNHHPLVQVFYFLDILTEPCGLKYDFCVIETGKYPSFLNCAYTYKKFRSRGNNIIYICFDLFYFNLILEIREISNLICSAEKINKINQLSQYLSRS